MADEKERWLVEAAGDFETARILLREVRYSASAFHSRQSAENALKSLLHGLHDVPWGHSIMDLLARAHQLQPLIGLEELESCARTVDRHYIGARHPNACPSGTAADHYDEGTATEVLKCARRFLQISDG